MHLSLLLDLSLLSLALNDFQDGSQAILPIIKTRGYLAPLLLAEDAVRGAVHKEHLLLLRELAFHEPCADHVDDPHLDVRVRNLQGFGDAPIVDLAAGCAGC